MGCGMSKKDGGATSGRRLGLSTAVQVEIAAAPDTVWEVVTDIERLPEVVRFVNSVRIVVDDKRLRVGMKWNESRRFKTHPASTKTMEQTKTIVRLEDQTYPKSLGVNITFGEKEAFANTNTLAVHPVSDTECILILSLAVSFNRRKMGLRQRFSRKHREGIVKWIECYCREELQDFAAEAIRREQTRGCKKR